MYSFGRAPGLQCGHCDLVLFDPATRAAQQKALTRRHPLMSTEHWVPAARWGLGGLVAATGAYVVAFNWVTIPWNFRLRARGEKRHVSSVPIVGHLLLTMGLTFVLWTPSIHVLRFWLADWPTCTLPLGILIAMRRS